MIPDSRILEVWPLAPMNETGLVEWARKLMVKLTGQKTDIYNVFTPVYASAIEYSPSFANILKIFTTQDVGDCEISAKIGRIGPVWIIISNDGGHGKDITFGSGFSSAGILNGVKNETAVLEFISDGTILWEVNRIQGLT